MKIGNNEEIEDILNAARPSPFPWRMVIGVLAVAVGIILLLMTSGCSTPTREIGRGRGPLPSESAMYADLEAKRIEALRAIGVEQARARGAYIPAHRGRRHGGRGSRGGSHNYVTGHVDSNGSVVYPGGKRR